MPDFMTGVSLLSRVNAFFKPGLSEYLRRNLYLLYGRGVKLKSISTGLPPLKKPKPRKNFIGSGRGILFVSVF